MKENNWLSASQKDSPRQSLVPPQLPGEVRQNQSVMAWSQAYGLVAKGVALERDAYS